jgi:hypothetical protein
MREQRGQLSASQRGFRGKKLCPYHLDLPAPTTVRKQISIA